MGVHKGAKHRVAHQPRQSRSEFSKAFAGWLDWSRLSNGKEVSSMNKETKRSIVLFSAAVAGLLLLFGGMVPGEGTLSGVMDGSWWTGGNGLTWFSALVAVGLCLLLDRMLFKRKNNLFETRKSVIQKTNMEDRFERQRKGTHST